MEDVKERQLRIVATDGYRSFNPCFNGRCKRTNLANVLALNRIAVSILVLMEDVKEHGQGRKGGWFFY